MKLISIMTASALALLPIERALSQSLQVSPDGDRVLVPPKTKRERNLGLEGRPPGQIEQPSPDDGEMTTEEPDENLQDEALPPTPPVRPRQP